MKGKKRFIVTMLFFINIIMLVAAVIPHHHHPNGMICMKQDQPVEQQCPNHHHHPASDSCCSSECMTRFHSPIPSVHTDSGPNYVFVATLFTDTIIEHLLRPQERRVKITTSIVNPCTVRKYLVPPHFGPLPTLFLHNDVNASKLHLRYSIFVAYKNSKT